MKFIHAADIHLDSPLTGLTAYPDAPVDMLRTATRRAFSNLCTEAVEQEVDFMIIAGDLYDGTWKDFNTGIFFCAEMGRLKKAGIPAFILYGNHDAESEMTRNLQLPDNVTAFSSRSCSQHTLADLNVVLHGWSFKHAATTENLAVQYPLATPGMFNIGVLHTALEGDSPHANYAPCSVAQLQSKGYDYWALGHVHEFRHIEGTPTIVFPGNLQGRHVREPGPRGAVLVTVDDDGPIRVERLFVDVLRWHSLQVDVSGCATLAEVVRTIDAALQRVVDEAPAGIPSAMRVTLVGRTAAHGDLFGMAAQVRSEVLALVAALGSDQLWLEKVKIATADLDDGQAMAARADAIADLQAILAEAEQDPAFLDALRTDLMGLVSKAPPELQSSVPYFKEIRDGDLAQLVAEVRPALLSYLAKVH